MIPTVPYRGRWGTRRVPDPVALRTIREIAGLRQTDLARRAGYTKAWINRIEQGHVPCSRRVAGVYEVLR
jgi:predicted transcriptional regulator